MRKRGCGHGPRSEALERRIQLASAGTLLSYDFTSTAWQQSPGALSSGVTATLQQGGYGTIDTAGSTTTSGALRLTVNSAPAGSWSADLTSGQLAVTNTETNLGKLTLAFMLSTSQARPVGVVVSSYNSSGTKTGSLATTISPAAAYTYQRYALDLSTMTPTGSGTFDPTAPKVSFDFEMNSANGWTTASAAQLRLDDVNYAKPAYYVNAATGKNTNSGRTEQTAFATPQAALNIAQPGDIIDVMSGTYNVLGSSSKIQFTKGGTPAAWVTLKNYPGQSPIIYSEYWNAILVGNGTSTSPSTGAAVAYVEIRGLHIEGDSPKVGSRTAPDGDYDPTAVNADQYGPYAQYINQVDGRTNGNGISVDGRYETNKPHDIRIADNIVEDCAGGGIGAMEADRVMIENNVSRNNCFWDIYGTSGISVLSKFNFDGTSGSYTRIVRNNQSYGNIHKEMWAAVGKYSDGNGIIIDYNHTSASDVANGVPYVECNGRTLVTNNVVYNNGGSGIHSYGSYHVDIVNNTAYLNSASPYLQYGEIFAGSAGTADSAKDVNIYNNILYAPTANISAGESAEPVNGGMKPTSSNAIVYKNNVYYGGNTAAWAADAYDIGNVTANPKFVAPSIDPTAANFNLQSSSPAINLGTTTLAPYLDASGAVRYGNPDAGAYEFIPAAPAAVTLAAASDTGKTGDNITKLNNSSSATRLGFVITGTLSGSTVALYSGNTLLGTATATGTTTTVTTDGVTAMPNGAASITAIQTFAGAPSAASAALGITIDTTTPSLSAVVSRKTHGTAGIFDLPLSLTGSPTVEPRQGGGSQLVWTFSESVIPADGSLDANDFSVANATFASASIVGSTLTLNLSNVVNGKTSAVALTGLTDIAGNAIGGVSGVSVGNLFGDVNQSRSVSVGDQQAVKNNLLQTLSIANFLFDVNLSGSITVGDQQAVKNALLTTLS